MDDTKHGCFVATPKDQNNSSRNDEHYHLLIKNSHVKAPLHTMHLWLVLLFLLIIAFIIMTAEFTVLTVIHSEEKLNDNRELLFQPKRRSLQEHYLLDQQQQHGTKNLFQSNVNTSKSTIEKEIIIPPLESVIQKRSLVGDPQWLLDFVIIGHGKCSTTTMMHWLADHPDIQCFREETFELWQGKLVALIKRLYTELSNPIQKRGYKNPQEIRNIKSLKILKQLFPKTVLIVGIRHPITWFQSFLNFKIQNLGPRMPFDYFGDANLFIGQCPLMLPNTQLLNNQRGLGLSCVGTEKSMFHVHLAMLGKTNISETMKLQYPILQHAIDEMPNPIYLFETKQLLSSSSTNNNNNFDSNRLLLQVGQDLKQMLNLTQNFQLPPPTHSPGKQWNDTEFQKKKDQYKIDICHSDYIVLRQHLLKIAREASYWIRNSGFLDHPTVKVSNRKHFVQILATDWMKDPCNDKLIKK